MRKKTILIVDEDESIIETLKVILEDENYNVLTALSEENVLDHVASSSIDVVLTDIEISGIDGFELYKKIIKSNPNLPVIMMSGQANIDTAFYAGAIGVYAFIEKPISLDKLLVIIKRAFKKDIRKELIK